MRRQIILILLVIGMLSLIGCKKKAEEESAFSAWEGTYLKAVGHDMIYLDGEGPTIMEKLTDEQKAMLAEHKTGDILKVEIDRIEESYPAHCYPKSVEFVREGSEDSLDEEELKNLRNMGWHIITEDHPDGLSQYEFSLTWGVYGISSYDSKTGKLVKTNDATHPEEYVTTHLLTPEERTKVWDALMYTSYEALPEEFDPYDGVKSEPSRTIILKLDVEGKTYEIRCEDIAMDGATGTTNEGRSFLKGIDTIVKVLTDTEEWQALPDYEFYYE